MSAIRSGPKSSLRWEGRWQAWAGPSVPPAAQEGTISEISVVTGGGGGHAGQGAGLKDGLEPNAGISTPAFPFSPKACAVLPENSIFVPPLFF